MLSSVVLNGSAVFIGPALSVETETDKNGRVSLFDRVRSLTPALYRFEVDGFEKSIDVNPASGMQEKFQSLTAAELRAATITTQAREEPLLDESFRTGADKNKVDLVTGSLNRVAALSNATNGVAAGITQVGKAQPFSSQLQPDTVADGYQWGLQADANGIKTADKSAMDRLISAGENIGEFFKNLGEGVADFFEGLVKGFKEGGIKGGFTFVLHKTKEAAKDVFEFVCAIGSEIKRFVLNTLEEVGNFFVWLWEQCKVGLEKVWEFLKFIFNWGDVMRTKDFIVEFLDGGLQEIPRFVESMRDGVEDEFDRLIAQVNKWRSTPPIASASQSSKPVSQVYKGSTKKTDLITGNSTLSWISEKLSAGMNEIIEIEEVEGPASSVNPVNDFIKGVWNDFGEELSRAVK